MDSNPSKSVLKTSAKAGWLFLSNLIVFTALGTLFNWTAFLFFARSIWQNACHTGAIAPHASGAGAIIALVFIGLACFKPIGLTLLFAIAFPFLYFLAGKSRGVKQVVAYLLRENQAWVLEKMRPAITKFVNLVRRENPANMDPASTKTMRTLLSNIGALVENAPAWLRLAIRFVWRRSQPSRWIHEITGLQDRSTSIDSAVDQIEARLQVKMADATQVNSQEWMILMALNAIAMVLTYWLV